MFSFYKVILDLLKARTHKYVRRVPIGSTHTGGTKYKYYYQEQAGHGKGLGHESELVKDASFSFGEGENKYHAHIKSVDGDKLTIEYDDGDKKGTKETLSKTEFQNRIHKEHATSIKNAHEKAKKQLATFEKMKEKGAKVKDSTLNKLKAQVEKLNQDKQEQPQNLLFPLSHSQEQAINKWDTLREQTPLTMKQFEKSDLPLGDLIRANIKLNLNDALDYLINKDLYFSNPYFNKYKAIPNLKQRILDRMPQENFAVLIPSTPHSKPFVDEIKNQTLSDLNNKKEVKDLKLYQSFIHTYVSPTIEALNSEKEVQDFEAFNNWEKGRKKRQDFTSKLQNSFITALYRKDPEKVADAYLKNGTYRKDILSIPNGREKLISKIKNSNFSFLREDMPEHEEFYQGYALDEPLDFEHQSVLLSPNILKYELDSKVRDILPKKDIPF
jgi:hypothetical protein